MPSVAEDPVGRIISIDEASGLALVEVRADATCARCASGKGCGAGLLGGRGKSRRIAANIPQMMSLQRGDSVRISLLPGNLLRAAALVYGAPLFGALLGALSAFQLQLPEVAAVPCALVGLGIGIVAVRVVTSKQHCVADFTPSISAHLGITPQDTLAGRTLGDA